MDYSRRYSRFFITLNQDSDRFKFDLRECMGKSVIEIRSGSGKLLVYAQGLKPRVLYKVTLVNARKNKSLGVSAGNIHIDDSGKGEFRWDFEPDNVGSSKSKIEEFNVVAITAEGMGELVVPLVGYIGDECQWKDNFKLFSLEENEEIEEVNEPENKNDFVNDEQQNISEEIEDDDQQDFSEKIDDDQQDFSEKTKDNEDCEDKNKYKDKDIKHDSEYKEHEKSEIDYDSIAEDTIRNEEMAEKVICESVDFDDIIQKFRKDMLELEEYTSMKPIKQQKYKFKDRGIDNVLYIEQHYPRMAPFPYEQSEFKWYRIGPHDLPAIDRKLWKFYNNPFINYNYRKYKHLLLGLHNVDDKQSYVLGIPSVYDDEFAMQSTAQGYHEFKSSESKSFKNGDYGYWIMKF